MDTPTIGGMDTATTTTNTTSQPPLSPDQRPPLGTPRPVDVHVGARLRQRRTLLGMSQEKLGEAIGLTFQQVQKYERGANRIGASRLYQIAGVLDVEIQYFFDEMPGAVQRTRGDYAATNKASEIDATQTGDPLARRETLELVRAYYKIDDVTLRKRAFDLVKAIGNRFEQLIAAED